MAEISYRDFKDEYDNIIGTVFIITERQSDIRGVFQDKCRIYISYGEIVCAEKTDVGHHDIYENDIENRNVVEKVLRVFLEKAPNEFKYIFGRLNPNSKGYKIAEEIIDSEINKLEEKTKTLKLMKG